MYKSLAISSSLVAVTSPIEKPVPTGCSTHRTLVRLTKTLSLATLARLGRQWLIVLTPRIWIDRRRVLPPTPNKPSILLGKALQGTAACKYLLEIKAPEIVKLAWSSIKPNRNLIYWCSNRWLENKVQRSGFVLQVNRDQPSIHLAHIEWNIWERVNFIFCCTSISFHLSFIDSQTFGSAGEKSEISSALLNRSFISFSCLSEFAFQVWTETLSMRKVTKSSSRSCSEEEKPG